MFVKFIIAAMMIFTAGPLHNEGGSKCIETKGTKECVSDTLANGKPVDYSKMND